MHAGLASGRPGGVIVGRGVAGNFPHADFQHSCRSRVSNGISKRQAQGIAVGILTTLLFTLPPLLAIRRVRPGLLLRRDMAEVKLPLRKRIPEPGVRAFRRLCIPLGIAGIAAWLRRIAEGSADTWWQDCS